MRLAPRSLIGSAAAITGAILFAAGWLLTQEPPPLQTYRLPDGSVLRLQAVTVGSRHHLVLGSNVQRLLAPLAPLLPPAIGARFQPVWIDYQSPTPETAVFWVTGRNWSPQWARVVAYNERGEGLDVTNEGPFFPSEPMSGEWMRCWILPVFPRRGAWLGLRTFGMDPTTPLVDFRVCNPVPGPYPTWRAAPLPQTQRVGPVTLTLTDLSQGRLPNGWGMGSCVDLRCTESGQPTRHWEPVGIRLSDATGNLLVPAVIQRALARGITRLQFPGMLPSSEVEKLRVELVPTRDFGPIDLVTLRDLGVPVGESAADASESKLELTREGARLRWHVRLRWAPRWPGHPQALLADVSGPPRDGTRIGLIRAIDERGRPCVLNPPGEPEFPPPRAPSDSTLLEVNRPIGRRGRSFPETSTTYELLPPAGASRVSLTFAVVQSRFVEYLARPSRPAPAPPATGPLPRERRRPPA